MKSSLGTLAALLVAAACGYGARSLMIRPVTVAAQSPDGKRRILVVERPRTLDRNFTVELEDADSKIRSTLFSSPDEGKRGYERLAWSADGTRALLLGRNFSVVEGATLATGEQLYLMTDLNTGEMWCNASQQTRHPRFGSAEIGQKQWVGWTPPK